MPRVARTKSASGIYHVVMRGVGRQLIFEDDDDRRALLEKLGKLSDEGCLTVYAWCLMSNHFHLLIKEGCEPIASAMKRLGVSYAMRFNLKTGRVGHVFQDRFSSEPVESDEYFLTVVRYIHNNPQKAGMCARQVRMEQLPGVRWCVGNLRHVAAVGDDWRAAAVRRVQRCRRRCSMS